jgi:hypothetical protein
MRRAVLGYSSPRPEFALDAQIDPVRGRTNHMGGDRVQLILTDQEKELLTRVVDQYYSSLREEIYKTEGYEFKQKLKEEEALIQALLARLKA